MVKETIVATKSGGHRIGFKIIPLFVLKIVLADTRAWGGRRTPVQSCGFESSFDTTVILQIFGASLFSVFSVVNGFTEIKKTPKCEKHI